MRSSGPQAAPRLRETLPYMRRPFVADWPLPSYLSYARGPTLYFVSKDGTFEGFQRIEDSRPVFRGEAAAGTESEKE